jgi:hypothetical protein
MRIDGKDALASLLTLLVHRQRGHGGRDSDTPGTPYGQRIVFDTVVVDQPIEEARFERP